MAFHPHVIEVKDYLHQSKDKRLEMMKTLTEPKDSVYASDYEAMWQSIFKAEQENCGGLDNKWVLNFLDAVADATDLPPYFYISKQERNELIEEIKKHTDKLKKIYTYNRFNQEIIYDDGLFTDGFHAYEEIDNVWVEKSVLPKASVTDALDLFAKLAEESIRESFHDGKAGKNIEAIRFVRLLGARNIERYSRPLLRAIKTATTAVYGIEYLDSDVSNLLNRKKFTKAPETEQAKAKIVRRVTSTI